MHLLVTAGNTMALIDRVRCITNIFTGRTGASIAQAAHQRGHAVTLLTSHPEAAGDLGARGEGRSSVVTYRTFEDLQERMAQHIGEGPFDAVVHGAAVSDYLSAGVYSLAEGTTFDETTNRWLGEAPALVDRRAGKVKSDEPELWVRLKRAPKLIDRIRTDWGFAGVLVKFKLEVGRSDEALLEIAEASRAHSCADLMVANTLEGASGWAYLGPIAGRYERIERRELADRLVEAIETLHRARH
jgi:phosphopantothenoylcysteine synthetase/decarboxylase